jgi:Tfp pilus assembly protein PilF
MLAEQNRLNEAIPLARRAVEVEPHAAQNRFNLALMYLNHNQPELARQQLEAVLRLDPNHAGARELLK